MIGNYLFFFNIPTLIVIFIILIIGWGFIKAFKKSSDYIKNVKVFNDNAQQQLTLFETLQISDTLFFDHFDPDFVTFSLLSETKWTKVYLITFSFMSNDKYDEVEPLSRFVKVSKTNVILSKSLLCELL